MKNYELWYEKEAPFGYENIACFEPENIPDEGWENWSLPLGNGYMGVNVFGRVNTERLQITENSLSNPYVLKKGGLNNFCELYLDFGHEHVENYRRGLRLNDGTAYTTYRENGVDYTRQHFTSYPDKVFVTKLSSSAKSGLSFTIRPGIPYVKPYLNEEGDGMGKTGMIETKDNLITLSGIMEYYGIQYEGQIHVAVSSGKIVTKETTIEVTQADSAVILMAVGTNYKMESRVFLEKEHQNKLAPYPHPHDAVTSIINEAKNYSYEELLERHKQDYYPLIQRASIDLGGDKENVPTDVLLEEYRKGSRSRYLEELYFQYGRYLLISSSRPGTYPANLQGTWNCYEKSPWSAGYWHNINVQMNYWPAFNTNLLEMFEPYIDYFKAYRPLAEELASDYIKHHFPENFSDKAGENGWIIGTGGWLYKISGMSEPFTGHSGPGTGELTSKLFWDYYAFTMDENHLKDTVYPAILSLSRFYQKVLISQDDKLLAKYSASPEQRQNGVHYHTTGCAFDQQMIYENYHDTLKAADILGCQDPYIEKLREDIKKLDPVLVGESGQIKEYREESHYGDIGDHHHRHISHLIGLYPGTVINCNTPQWMKAAEFSLNQRGDESTGWSTAHKLNTWARLKKGNRAYDLLKMILSKCTLNNLWDTHPPFQIDGNFGATAGIAEMLLQSHEDCIHILPALPDEWSNGAYSGLTARGNFEISVTWQERRVKTLEVLAKSNGICRIFLGDEYKADCIKDGYITFTANEGQRYSFDFS